jgi:hypothetical protein
MIGKIMVGKKARSHKAKHQKTARKTNRTGKPAQRTLQPKQNPHDSAPTLTRHNTEVQPSRSVEVPSRPVFSIEIRSIGGDTTIGDLIVAFPRTRDILVKHGLRLDVEEAGYLYMTLNVFSAIHGLSTNGLVEELHTASKESPTQPTQPQLRTIVTPPMA